MSELPSPSERAKQWPLMIESGPTVASPPVFSKWIDPEEEQNMPYPLKEIKREALGFQNNAEGKATHEIHECIVEERDGAITIKWVALDINVPITQDALFVFLDKKPRVDVLYKEVDKGKSHLNIS